MDDYPYDYKQTSVFEIKACTASQRRNTTQYATYQHLITAGPVYWALSAYSRDGGNYEELRNKISKAFSRNAKIDLTRKNKYPASDSRSKKVVEQMSIEDYLIHFEKSASRIKNIKTDLTNVTRTPNYEYITSLTLIESYEEL